MPSKSDDVAYGYDAPGIDTSTHELVTKFLGDTGPPPNVVEFTGYFGPSDIEGNVRLYLGLDFMSYFEIPLTGITSTTPADSTHADSPTCVLVKKEADLELVKMASISGDASFFNGCVVSDFLAGAAANEGDSSGTSPFLLKSKVGKTCITGTCLAPTPASGP